MSEPARTLRDLLVQASIRHGSENDPASAHSMARKAQEAGHQIVYTTISAIMAGTYAVKKRPKRQTLEAIAFLAGVPYEAAHQAAGLGPPGRRFADQLPEDFDDLTLAQRDVVIRVGRALLDASKASADSGSVDWANSDHDRARNAGGSVAYVTDAAFDEAFELPRSGEHTGEAK